MCIEGKGNETIARILQENKVMIPMAYWQSKGLNKGGKKTQPDPYKWCQTTVGKILEQQEYCGDVINFKTYSKSFKNKKRILNPEENWKVFKGVHVPSVDGVFILPSEPKPIISCIVIIAVSATDIIAALIIAQLKPSSPG